MSERTVHATSSLCATGNVQAHQEGMYSISTVDDSTRLSLREPQCSNRQSHLILSSEYARCRPAELKRLVKAHLYEGRRYVKHYLKDFAVGTPLPRPSCEQGTSSQAGENRLHEQWMATPYQERHTEWLMKQTEGRGQFLCRRHGWKQRCENEAGRCTSSLCDLLLEEGGIYSSRSRSRLVDVWAVLISVLRITRFVPVDDLVLTTSSLPRPRPSEIVEEDYVLA